MPGAKTRFGFAGDGSEPPDSDEARGARTIIGRDLHLPMPPAVPPPSGSSPSASFSAARVVPTPIPRAATPMARAAVPVYQPEETTAELPSRRRSPPGQSRLARFLGRWSKSGRLISPPPMPTDDENLDIPRDPLARNVLLVLGVAVVTFLLTFMVVRLRHRVVRPSQSASSPAVPADSSRRSAPPPAPSAPRPAAVVAQPPSASPPQPAPNVAAQVATSEKAPGGPIPSLTAPHIPAPPIGNRATVKTKRAGFEAPLPPTAPSNDLPAHLKGELLPLAQ
jgi:hypothetical protein